MLKGKKVMRITKFVDRTSINFFEKLTNTFSNIKFIRFLFRYLFQFLFRFYFGTASRLFQETLDVNFMTLNY
jgi:hypothetical protein